jgi:CheY-like chemotaxis protein
MLGALWCHTNVAAFLQAQPSMEAPLIVVVDDTLITLKLVSIVLTYAGYRVTTYTTVPEAITAITCNQPALVILDLWIQAPDDGWDVCAALARDPSTATIPIIIFTGASPDRRKQPAHIHPKYLAFLDKPFELTDLLTAVKTALAS